YRFLDVGCAEGFLPLLVAERIPFMREVLGIDIDSEAFTVAREIAEERGLTTVRFARADLLADDFRLLGHFDTVVALHILEHIDEADMYRALTNLLQVTSGRLILAVPYEDSGPEIAYGHKQVFSRRR